MTRIEFLKAKIAYNQLKIAEQNLVDAFKEDLPDDLDLKVAMAALRRARDIDSSIETGLGRDREITLARLRDASFAIKVRMRGRIGRTQQMPRWRPREGGKADRV